MDPGEHVSETLHREFMEEALNSLENTEGEKLPKVKSLLLKITLLQSS